MAEQLDVAIKFWEQVDAASTRFHERGDQAVQFYNGVGTALAAWLMIHAPDFLLGSVAVFAFGLFGAGHVAYYHNRGYRLFLRTNGLARELADLVEMPPAIRTWDASDELTWRNLLVPGHPFAQALFNALIVLAIHTVYAGVLWFRGIELVPVF